MGIGEWAALGAALFWTVASMMWGRLHLSALGINFCKNWLASGFLLLHLAVVARLARDPVLVASPRAWFYLALSGIVGIVIGDVFYFRSLQILGPRRALLMASTSPLFAVALGWVFLREALAAMAITGILLTIVGVVVVVMDRQTRREAPEIMPGSLSTALWYGVLGALCQAGGGVLSKLGMLRSADGELVTDCPALEATWIRLVVAAIGTTMVVIVQRKWPEIRQQLSNRATLGLIFPATACGTWMGIWLSQIAYKESPVAIAQTLTSTTPLFAIPLVWWLYGHRSTWYSVVATVIALVGIYLTVT